jgi:phosphoribosyl 1,2-cyclic phosphate phosphodiesterase
MRFTLLGSGTSTGIPSVGCNCETCTSSDLKDKRLRPSLLVEDIAEGRHITVVIDTSSDFRQQMLTYNVSELNAVVFTHHHFDHIGGFDDIRPYNFQQNCSMPVYCMERTLHSLKQCYPYAFGEAEQEGGGLPSVNTHIIDTAPFDVFGIRFVPIPMMHGVIRVNGYRIGNFAYCTDTNFIPDASLALLEGVEILILDALRYHPHPTHFTIEEAVEVAQKIGAKQTYFTHIAHQIKHSELDGKLPKGIQLGYDGLVVELI